MIATNHTVPHRVITVTAT